MNIINAKFEIKEEITIIRLCPPETWEEGFVTSSYLTKKKCLKNFKSKYTVTICLYDKNWLTL